MQLRRWCCFNKVGILFFILIFGLGSSGFAQVQAVYEHEVKQGETVYKLAYVYNVSSDSIKHWNQLSSNDINSGQVLKIINYNGFTIYEVKLYEIKYCINQSNLEKLENKKNYNFTLEQLELRKLDVDYMDPNAQEKYFEIAKLKKEAETLMLENNSKIDTRIGFLKADKKRFEGIIEQQSKENELSNTGVTIDTIQKIAEPSDDVATENDTKPTKEKIQKEKEPKVKNDKKVKDEKIEKEKPETLDSQMKEKKKEVVSANKEKKEKPSKEKKVKEEQIKETKSEKVKLPKEEKEKKVAKTPKEKKVKESKLAYQEGDKEVDDNNHDMDVLVFDVTNEALVDTSSRKYKKQQAKLHKEFNAELDSSKAVKNIMVDEVEIESKKKTKFKIGDDVGVVRKEKAKFYLSRAKLEIDKDNYKKANEFINKSLNINPSYADAYMLKGDMLASLSYYDKAISQYQKANFLDNQNAQLHYNIGNCWIFLEKPEFALSKMTDAIQVDSNYILAYMGRSSLYVELKLYEKALDDYSRILGINKYFYPALKGKGMSNLKLGNYENAIRDFNQLLEYEDKDPSIYYHRGMAKLYLSEIYGSCMDFLAASEKGYAPADKAINKHCD